MEWAAGWLPGYEGSQPVRIGNAAVGQFQLDVFGEVAAALNRIPPADDEARVPAAAVQAALIDHLCQVCRSRTRGYGRFEESPNIYAFEVMAWVALDRAIKNHEQFDGAGDVNAGRRIAT